MNTRDWGSAAVLLAAFALLAGCATKPHPVAHARVTPEIAEAVRTGDWVLGARIVADERPTELLGELSAEGRAAFEDARSARVASRPHSGMNPASGGQVGAHIAGCIISVVGIVACPLGLAIGSAVHGIVNGVRYIKAEAREPALLIPEEHAQSLAVIFKDGATGRALVERASRFAMPGQAMHGTEAEPRVMVRMKSVGTHRHRNGLDIRVIAEAQAYPATGLAPAPTEHVYAWTYGPVSEWTKESDELARQVLPDALEMLAASIASAYLGPWETLTPSTERGVANSGSGGLGLSPSSTHIPPSSVVSAQALDSLLPAAGDAWTYKLTEPKQRSLQARLHRVRIASVTPDTIVEELADEPGPLVRTLQIDGGYLIREGTVSLFSPYFTPYDASASSARITNVKNLDRDSCGAVWICSVSAMMVGKELVRVPAGEFEAVKVEVQHSWTARYPAAQSGGRTLTVWYSPQTKRAVKFSSRGSGGSSNHRDFDLELVSYWLN